MHTGANVHVTPVVPLIHLHKHPQQRNSPLQQTHPHICDLSLRAWFGGFNKVQFYFVFVKFI